MPNIKNVKLDNTGKAGKFKKLPGFYLVMEKGKTSPLKWRLFRQKQRLSARYLLDTEQKIW